MCKGTKVLLLVLSLVLCTALAAGAATPRHETLIADILTGRVANPQNFNGWATWVGNDKGMQQLIYDPLWIAEYVTGEVIPVLAENLPQYNEDFTLLKVNLREGIHWSDGEPFTAADVLFVFETIMATNGMNYHNEFNTHVAEVHVIDDYTVHIELNQPNSRFHVYLVDRWGGLRFFPKHIWQEVEDFMAYDAFPPIGTGPYTLMDFDIGGYWFLYEKRPDWDKTATGILYGEPVPQYVKFQYYGSPETRVMAMARHELDMADLTPEAFQALLQMNEYARGVYEDFPWAEILHPCVTGATFNNDHYPLDIKEVRWALNLALDAVGLVMTAYDGAASFSPFYVPSTLPFYEWYFEPMQAWLEEFTIDVNGEPFKPYDPEAPFRLAELSAQRGYPVPTEPDEVREMFGYGWWKHAPDVAEALLEGQGFSRDSRGRWLLPDGTRWEMSIIAHPNPAHPAFKWAFPLAEQWRRFGIEIEAQPMEQRETLNQYGRYSINTDWPIEAPPGGDPDLYRKFQVYHSDFYRPIGEQNVGHASRFHNEALDDVLRRMGEVGPDDHEASIALGIEAIKIVVEEMPGVSLAAYPSFLGWDEYYWTNYPGMENPYSQPHYHWPNFKFMLPFLEPTGRQ